MELTRFDMQKEATQKRIAQALARTRHGRRTMDDEQRDALRERNRRRAYSCSRCGASIEEIDGSQLSKDAHFPGVVYRVCRACGHEDVKHIRRKNQ